MQKEAIIITGSSGEIGKNLIDYFIRNSSTYIIALDLNQIEKTTDRIVFIKGNILDEVLLSQIDNKYNLIEIYHLAAILSSKAALNPNLATKINVDGTRNMFNLGLSQYLKYNNLVKIFFPSSIAVYGQSDQSKSKNLEYMNCNPITIYGQNKLYCENIGTALNKFGDKLQSKIDFRCIRFPGIISSNTIPSGGTSDYIPEMIHKGLNKMNYQCFVNKNSVLPFITMPDAISAIINLMKTKKNKLTTNVYNITSFSPTIGAVLNKIIHINKEFKLTYSIDNMRQKIVDSWPQNVDDSLATKDWNWRANHDFDKAFSDYLIPTIMEK